MRDRGLARPRPASGEHVIKEYKTMERRTADSRTAPTPLTGRAGRAYVVFADLLHGIRSDFRAVRHGIARNINAHPATHFIIFAMTSRARGECVGMEKETRKKRKKNT